jgi:replicative DNA helicase
MDSRTEFETATPQAELAERRLLAAILRDNNCAFEAMSRLQAGDFYLESRQKLFAFFCRLVEQGKPFDLSSVSESLMKARKLNSVGGMDGLIGISDALGVESSIPRYCDEILTASRHRKLIHLLGETLDKAQSSDADPDELIGQIQNFTIAVTRHSEQETVAQVAQSVMKQILDIHSGQKIAGGISTSLKGLDEITAGIKPGEYIVIAGRTGQGKSSLARQIVLNAAKSGNRPLFCTIEMTKENLVQCMAATESRVPFDLILDPRYMTQEQLEKVAQSVKQIQELPLEIDDMSGMELSELCARIRSRIIRGTDLVVVDYLQLIRVRGADSDYDRVTKASAALRELANVTKVPVIALSQLRRPTDEKEPAPSIYGLKESGNIENDAFQVWLIFRPKTNETGSWRYTGMDQIIVGKNRNGPCDTIPVVYEGPYLNFKMREK